MMRFLKVLVVCSISLAARGQDVIHLKSGESSACEIEAVTDNIVIFLLRGPGGGTAKRTIPMDRVEYLEFGYEQGEEAVFSDVASISVENLESWWEFHFEHLHRPRSRTAAYGNAFGEALLREKPDTGASRALSVFDRIIERAWDEKDVAMAKQGRLRALIAMGDLDTAIGEAQVLASETEDPDLLIEVKYLLAEADFEKLNAIQKEHPKWEEDDEVRPERNELYHRIIDQYLWPHLFHATREEAAARGLMKAGEVYEFAKESDFALAAYQDLTNLYPETSSYPLAKERLESLSSVE